MSKMEPDTEWEETTAVYQPEPQREGMQAALHEQSFETLFERARQIGTPLPTPFLYSLHLQSCIELANRGRRPPRHKEDKQPDPELGPDRIFVGFDGQVRIDWAARENSQSKPPRSYRSPERIRGLPTNGRADLFSLALIIAELFVLKRLSDGEGSVSSSEGASEFAEMLRNGTRIPRELGSVLLKSLAFDVDQRPVGVTSLIEDLERIGRKLDLHADPAIAASHLRRLFFDPAAQSTPPSARPEAPDERDERSLPLAPPLQSAIRPAEFFPRRPTTPTGPSSSVERPICQAATPPVSCALLVRPEAPKSDPPPATSRTLPPTQTQTLPSPPQPYAREGWRWARFSITKLAVAVALGAAMSFLFLRPGRGKVFVAASGPWGEPLPRAVTELDGRQSCSGARCAFEVSPGVHEVTIRAEGYVPQLQIVALNASESAAMNFRLERGSSTLKISGSPEGALVAVDGESMGRLPLQMDLAPGTHHLHLESEHFLPLERDIELNLGEATHLNDIDLRPLIGKATLDIRTPGLEIAIFSGNERLDHLDVAQPVELDLSRPWTLEARKSGYPVLREPLEFDGAMEKTFVVALEKPALPAFATKSARGAAAPAEHTASGSASNNSDVLRAAMQQAIDEIGAPPRPSDEDPQSAGPISTDPCFVTFNSIPVSNVFVDNTRLGITPILKARVKPGTHVAQFIQGDTRKTKSFVCKGGEPKVFAINLNR
jgi:hypothetical protein